MDRRTVGSTQLCGAKVFRAVLRYRRQQIDREIFSTRIVFIKPVLPSRVIRRVLRATEPALISYDQPTLEPRGDGNIARYRSGGWLVPGAERGGQRQEKKYCWHISNATNGCKQSTTSWQAFQRASAIEEIAEVAAFRAGRY